MIDSIKNISINECNDARTLYLYLYLNNGKDLETVSNKLLETGNLRYIHFLLRSFEIKEYEKYLNFIIENCDAPSYLYNILYDVDYLDDETRIKIINKIFELNDNRYIVKAVYYFFNVLKKHNIDIFNRVKGLLEDYLKVEVNEDSFSSVLDKIIYQEDYEIDYPGFSNNCFKGRNGHIPNIIVCHINNTYGAAIKRFYDETSEVSAHYVIRRDGHVKQVISLDDSAWANGTSLNEESDIYYKFAKSSIISNTIDNANYYTFSIEHESFDGSLTKEQIAATVGVMKDIIKYLKDKYNYDFIIDCDHIIGHSDVNPIVRTKCPGKEFPFETIINELKNNN